MLHDHHQPGGVPAGKLGKPKSWFGGNYAAEAILADLDIVIADYSTGNALALVEIEETTDKPKVLLGDVLATLLGDHVSFLGKELHVGPGTSLIVLARSPNPAHRKRIAFLEEQANLLKSALATPNARIGRVVIRSFHDKQDLEETLKTLIQNIIVTQNRLRQPENEEDA